jgi:hypothetical protein
MRMAKWARPAGKTTNSRLQRNARTAPALEYQCSRQLNRILISTAKPAKGWGTFMTKRQANKLHQLRRDLICLSWQTRQARRNGSKDIETEVSLEREIMVRQIENHKKGAK